jgi:hypothetical protein
MGLVVRGTHKHIENSGTTLDADIASRYLDGSRIDAIQRQAVSLHQRIKLRTSVNRAIESIAVATLLRRLNERRRDNMLLIILLIILIFGFGYGGYRVGPGWGYYGGGGLSLILTIVLILLLLRII